MNLKVYMIKKFEISKMSKLSEWIIFKNLEF